MQVISEGPTKITKATIEAAWRRRAKGRRLIIRDKDCRGLALIVNATAMAWIYSYRPRGADPLTKRRWPNRTMTLGSPASKSIDEARTEANRLKGEAKAGADPLAEKKARAAAERRQRAATLGRLADEYEQILPKRPKLRGTGLPTASYVADEVAQLRLALDGMENEPAAKLTVQDVRKVITQAEGSAAPRARFGALARFLDWCLESGHIATNPCAGIPRSRRPKAPAARAHYLTPADLARLWRAAERLREPVWRDLARFLIAVPCRRGEAARLDWSHLDVAGAEWRQPLHLTKNRDPHRLHLHPAALNVLRARIGTVAQPRSGLVFPAPVSAGPIDTFSDIKRDLTAATKPKDGDASDTLAGWSWHDFRRSFATALGEAGIPESVADAVLNHRQSATRGGVLGVYQRASRWPEQVKAMELWGRILSAAIEGKDAVAEVVPMPIRVA